MASLHASGFKVHFLHCGDTDHSLSSKDSGAAERRADVAPGLGVPLSCLSCLLANQRLGQGARGVPVPFSGLGIPGTGTQSLCHVVCSFSKCLRLSQSLSSGVPVSHSVSTEKQEVSGAMQGSLSSALALLGGSLRTRWSGPAKPILERLGEPAGYVISKIRGLYLKPESEKF